jgi:hypothetical protein
MQENEMGERRGAEQEVVVVPERSDLVLFIL